jgi:translocation and assembly module TamB
VFVSLGGDVKNPKIKLSSDPSLEETDIISYLIFGSSSDQLGTGERSSLSQAATGLAGGVALNQLKGVLGDDISPDVLSFGTGTAGPELEVGKYLNDDLYFAYERKSSSDSSSSIPTNTVKVEYRLFDFLSVGSDVGSESSGGDLFLNFDF